MCGFAGFLAPGSSSDQAATERVAGAMADRLVHRGPDDSGVWADASAGIAIGFRRLSIIDLSAAGHQPMTSRSGRYVIAFNGEIYNHRWLRDTLDADEAVAWRGHSDTETLAEAIDRNGFEATLKMLDGMFAIAAWDRQERRLLLARDRFGEKPLYYGRQGRALLFGSELKALVAHPEWRGAADEQALALFLRHGYVPGPYSAYQGIAKLTAGCWLTINSDGSHAAPVAYWSATAAAAAAAEHPFRGSFEDACHELDNLLHTAVRNRRIADVPLGTFLSGGIDSTLVTAILQSEVPSPIYSFCMGFPQSAVDEAPHARRAATHIGTSHTELSVDTNDLLAVVPKLVGMYDEPFADASQIPTAVLCARAREYVTVALSGDGGDELFGGYPRYGAAAAAWAGASRRNASVQRLAGHGLRVLSGRPGGMARRLRRRLRRLAATQPEAIYRDYVSWWPEGELSRHPVGDTLACFDRLPAGLNQIQPPAARFSVFDAITYLPDDLEVKIDRASMAAGMEIRAPLLDHRIAEFAWSLPVQWRMADGEGKIILRTLLYRYLPRALVDRPKQGFEPPIGQWLRHELRDWAEHLLEPADLADSGLVEPSIVRERWREHTSGQRNWAYSLWVVLMLQAWRAQQRVGSVPDRRAA